MKALLSDTLSSIHLGANLMVAFFMAFIFLSVPAFAKSTPWHDSGNSKTRIMLEKQSVRDQAVIKGAIEIDLSPGWHTYWRTPGDTGLPPEFNWSGSKNIKDIDIHWPAPERFETSGFYSYGFKDHVVLPFTLSLKDAGRDFTLETSMKVMVCNQICVPEKTRLSLSLSPGSGETSPHNSRIEKAFRELPHKGDSGDLAIRNLVMGLGKMVVTVEARRGIDPKADLFVEIPGSSLSTPPQILPNPDSLKGAPKLAQFIVSGGDKESLSSLVIGKKVRLTLVNHGRAIEKSYDF